MPDQNNIEIDWHYAIGDALCGIVIEVKNEGDYYYAKYKYKIMDIYEWGWHYSRDNYELHMLHELGLAHEFLFEGTYEGVEFWRKGERYEERAN